MRQVRHVVRILEPDTCVTASRLPRLLHEFIGTLEPYSSDRKAHDNVLGRIGNYRISTSIDDKNLIESHKNYIKDFSARRLASALRESIENRTSHLIRPVNRHDVKVILRNEICSCARSWKTSCALLLIRNSTIPLTIRIV